VKTKAACLGELTAERGKGSGLFETTLSLKSEKYRSVKKRENSSVYYDTTSTIEISIVINDL